MEDKKSIKEILELANSDADAPTSETVEFEFAENTSLIFETENSDENKTADERFGTFEFSEEENAADGEGEFVLPDIFDIGEESREAALGDTAGLYTTYVPRFTEVSENYRMRTSGISGESVSVLDYSHTSENSSSSKLDATAEIAENLDGANVVEVDTARPGESDDVKTVYKFADPNLKRPMPKIRTLDDEKREINELMGVLKEPEAESKTADGTADVMVSEGGEKPKITISDSAVKEAVRGTVGGINKSEAQTAVEQAIKNYKNNEFSAPVQRDGFKDRFLDQLLSIKVRFAVAAVLTVIILLFENLELIGVELYSALFIPKYTGIPVLLDLQLAVCVFLLVIPEIITAITNLIRGKVSSELSLMLSLVILIAYSLSVYSLRKTDYAMFGFLFAVHADAAIISAYFKKSADFSAFKLVGGKEKKRALVVTPTRELPSENMALDGAIEEYKSKTVNVMPTAFVSDFFKRTGAAAEKNSQALLVMGASLGASLVCGIVSYFLSDGAFSFITSLALVFLMSMPAFSALTSKFVYYHAASLAKKEGFAVIGQSALSEYSDADVVVFEDVEIFSEDDVKLRNFSGDMTKGMRQMCAIFSAVGGPLENIFSAALDRKCESATDIVIEEDGISGKLDGKLVYAGSEAYMLRHGAKFEENIRTASSVADSSKIMYAAEDGAVYASFRISYSFSESFAMVIPSLKEEKIVPLIVTRDPNITNELIKTLTMGADALRVLRKTEPKMPVGNIERRASAGIVGVSEQSSVLYAMLLSKRSAALSSRFALTEIMAMAVGAALGVALSLGGMSQAPTAALGLWQLFWCVGVGFLSYREYRQE